MSASSTTSTTIGFKSSSHASLAAQTETKGSPAKDTKAHSDPIAVPQRRTSVQSVQQTALPSAKAGPSLRDRAVELGSRASSARPLSPQVPPHWTSVFGDNDPSDDEAPPRADPERKSSGSPGNASGELPGLEKARTDAATFLGKQLGKPAGDATPAEAAKVCGQLLERSIGPHSSKSDAARLGYVLGETFGGRQMTADMRAALIQSFVQWASQCRIPDVMDRAGWFLAGLSDATRSEPRWSHGEFLTQVAAAILKPSLTGQALEAYYAQDKHGRLLESWMTSILPLLSFEEANTLNDSLWPPNVLCDAQHQRRARACASNALNKSDRHEIKAVKERNDQLRKPSLNGQDFVEDMATSIRVHDASRKELSHRLVFTIERKSPKPDVGAAQATDQEAMVFPREMVLELSLNLTNQPSDVQFKTIGALAHGFASRPESSYRDAATWLQTGILLRSEPVRSLLVCAYTQGLAGDRKAMEQSWVQAAVDAERLPDDKTGTTRRQRLLSVKAGMALASNPVAAYAADSPIAPEDRLVVAHTVMRSQLRDLKHAGVTLETIDASAIPAFDKALLATELVCQRDATINRADVTRLRKQLIEHDRGDLQPQTLSPRQIGIGTRVAGLSISEMHIALAPRLDAPFADIPLPMENARAMLGHMLSSTYQQLTEHALQSAEQAFDRIPRDLKASEGLEVTAAFLEAEKKALAVPGVSTALSKTATRKLDDHIQQLHALAAHLRAGRPTAFQKLVQTLDHEPRLGKPAPQAASEQAPQTAPRSAPTSAIKK